ncbi:ZP domain-containing protein [Aphelenchoides fujianensis]|nr:ZP domain-containing protein [Aphelenchoides fujianensis]
MTEFVHFEVPTKAPFRGRIFVKGEVGNRECSRSFDVAESPDDSHDSNDSNEIPDERAEADVLRRPTTQPVAHDLGGAGSGWRRYLNGDGGVDGKDVGVDKPASLFGAHQPKRSPFKAAECPLVLPAFAELDVPMAACNAQRDRMLNPPAMQVSFVVIVSFHHHFLTKKDRAFRVQCIMPPTVELADSMPPPQCSYSITSNGAPLKHVRVGDRAEHEWTCKSAGGSEERLREHFGLLVHSCVVDDGKGRKQEVIDERGCSLDPLILPTPEYSTTSALRLGRRFGRECEIKICMRDDGQCERLTPPDCLRPASNRSRRNVESGWKLHAPELTVLDPPSTDDEQSDLDRLLRPEPVALIAPQGDENASPYCISIAGFAVMIASSTFLLTVSAGVILAAPFLRSDPLESALRRLAKSPN